MSLLLCLWLTKHCSEIILMDGATVLYVILLNSLRLSGELRNMSHWLLEMFSLTSNVDHVKVINSRPSVQRNGNGQTQVICVANLQLYVQKVNRSCQIRTTIHRSSPDLLSVWVLFTRRYDQTTCEAPTRVAISWGAAKCS